LNIQQPYADNCPCLMPKPDAIVMTLRVNAKAKYPNAKRRVNLPFNVYVLLPPWEENPCKDPQTYG
jgi:hypothetical protein